MTYAACAARIQRRLDRMDGVEAAVSYATERATLKIGPQVQVPDLIAEVERLRYSAWEITPVAEDASPSGGDRADPVTSLRRRLHVSVAVFVPLGNLSLGWALVPGRGSRVAVDPDRADRAGGDLGGLASPPGGPAQRPARRLLDGDPGVLGHRRGGVVVRSPDLRDLVACLRSSGPGRWRGAGGLLPTAVVVGRV